MVYAGKPTNFIIVFADAVVGIVAFFVFFIGASSNAFIWKHEAYGLARMNKTHTAGLCWWNALFHHHTFLRRGHRNCFLCLFPSRWIWCGLCHLNKELYQTEHNQTAMLYYKITLKFFFIWQTLELWNWYFKTHNWKWYFLILLLHKFECCFLY